ncbi:tyrosine-protein phosphatase [Paenibacillus radicis (ex Xue et al. 2023)]|uniref:Tyrosine-protein phosphatase n=1 Tax=Paenibacillus radicis (ex Xue et al. 2023) TaxID=2972489 RepID=A0ABT1YGT4_9BACL|nr:CpsB/CapC family capsule biosynthesis tyrosine phosphatase [Paenibacillus radicis (ex Xue et al. 2023)]MCR8632402.1 tyrosine protein phosphatase [Paenibacillus radicis (ex Xue et al. 2023)]
MIDIHSHLLPGIDDGASDLDETIRMAKMAVEEGIHTIICTPHHANGQYMNPGDGVNGLVKEVQIVLQENNIPLTIYPGQEIRINLDFIDSYNAKDIISLHESNYILVEFPSRDIPKYTEELFHELRVLGMTPIIAHPERNAEIASDPSKLVRLIQLGALAQVTSHSINGLFGAKIQKLAINMCKQQLVHFISSDAHNSTKRAFGLQAAYFSINSQIGKQQVAYYQMNAEKLVRNERVETVVPIWKRPKKWWFF